MCAFLSPHPLFIGVKWDRVGVDEETLSVMESWMGGVEIK